MKKKNHVFTYDCANEKKSHIHQQNSANEFLFIFAKFKFKFKWKKKIWQMTKKEKKKRH